MREFKEIAAKVVDVCWDNKILFRSLSDEQKQKYLSEINEDMDALEMNAILKEIKGES